jgi:hypothetical protein
MLSGTDGQKIHTGGGYKGIRVGLIALERLCFHATFIERNLGFLPGPVRITFPLTPTQYQPLIEAHENWRH